MTIRVWQRLGVAFVGIALLLHSQPAAAEPDGQMPLGPAPAAANRIIVKYRSRVSACVHCLLAHGVPFATLTGTDSLDRLNRRLGVRSARALFSDQHGLTGDRSAAYLSRLAAARDRLAARAARGRPATSLPDLSNVYALELPRGMDVRAAAALYAADPDVEYAQPDYERHITLTPNDPFFSSSGTWGQAYADLWGLHITQASTAWDTSTGTGTVVAVIDTGVDSTHQDLTANMWANPNEIPNNGIDDDNNGFVDDVVGWDFVDGTNTPMDEHGHGTHVAGTIAAVGDNGVGVVGMAWGARIMAVRGLDARGVGYDSDLAPAILYAAENGADVLNNSWGGFSFNLATGSQSVLRDAVDTAVGLGVVVVAAAGNDASNVSYFEPAGYPGVIAVGATDHTDARASFSNLGDALSVAAPGVDVLSLRSAISGPIDPFGQIVASKYIRLNGTSMASPHAAGLSAVLLSALPGLTSDEVRWHLELNADQPGYPGYEGLPWNPYYGWGRINAARVFDTPPVTTRLHGRADLHTYADAVVLDAATADFVFTTATPVGWTVATPSWLPASASAGSGPAQLSFSVDATGLAVGPYTGDVVVDAPTAADGGASFSATLQTHADPRIGGLITVSNDYVADTIAPSAVNVAADGIGELVVWARFTPLPAGVYAARVDGAGNVSGPYVIRADALPTYSRRPVAAFDGRNFLVVWRDIAEIYTYRSRFFVNTLNAMRVTSDGQPLDAAPIVLKTRKDRGNLLLDAVNVGFDGEAYTVIWRERSFVAAGTKIYARRVGRDGTIRGRAVRLYPNKVTTVGSARRADISPQLVCGGGNCLLAWGLRDGTVSSTGYYLDSVYGARLAGTQFVDTRAVQILTDINIGLGYPQVAMNGSDYLVVAGRVVACAESPFCGEDFMAARVTGAGVLLDPGGVRLNQGSAPLQGVGVPHLAADGTQYVVSFVGGGSRPGTQIFALRVTPNLQTIDSEQPGALVLPASLGSIPPTFGSPMAHTLSGAATQLLVTWVDTLNFDPSSPYVTWTNPISVQRALAHASPPGLPIVELGSIGPRSVRERETLSLVLSASTLTPGAATFSAANLPAGAVLDSTGIFRWTPAANEVGSYPGVHFEATDGSQTVSETITLTAVEANLALAGTVTNNDGTPAVGIALKLTGGVPARTLLTDAAGLFRFEDLVPGRYRIKLDRPSRKQYRVFTSPMPVTLAGSDRNDVSLVVTPK